MARIFISHSGANNDAARQMYGWLESNGWHDVFLDLDPVRGIRAGEIWQQALIAAADRCEAIICLVTPEWIASKWCWAEYVVAKKLGKRCFPVIVAPIDWEALPIELRAEHQVVDVTPDDATAWTRLRIGLEAAGVEAAGFLVPPGRRPYPGLQALTEDDAALFFGRDAEILTALDELRRMAEAPARRLLVLLGPSGSGKSSLLRAGLWPRLDRDDRNFLPLPTMRPGNAALTGVQGLWASLEGACGQPRIASHLPTDFPRSRGAIRAAVGAGTTACQDLLKELARAAGKSALIDSGKSPTIVLPIDQGEELFNADGGEEAEDFLTLLGELLTLSDGPLATIAIRTDVYPRLQADSRIASSSHQPFNLAPMPPDRFRAVIEGPAVRAGVQLEPALIDALVRGAAGADALPLLAFTMERLHREFGAAGRLKLADYETMGGVQGAIEAAVDTAFQAAPERGLPRDRDELARLTRAVFLPHLVRVNEAGEFARRTTGLDAIPPEAGALVGLLVDHRLLISGHDAEREVDTVEIAHEALLRAWPRMVEWLEEERDFLTWREEMVRARTRWEAGQRDLLGNREVALALDWRSTRHADIAAAELAFIAASAQRAAAAVRRDKRRQAWITWLAVTAALIFAVFGGISLWQWREATAARDAALVAQHEAQQQAALARARELAVHAETILAQRTGETTLAGLLAVESLRSAPTLEGHRAWQQVMTLTPREMTVVEPPWPWAQLTASPDGRWLAFSRSRGEGGDATPAAGEAVVIDAAGTSLQATWHHDGWVMPVMSPDGRHMAVAGFGRMLQVIDMVTGQVETQVSYDDMVTAAFALAGQRLFVARTDGIVEVRQGPGWPVRQRLFFPVSTPRPKVVTVSVNRDGSRVAVTTRGLKAYVILVDGTPLIELSGHEKGVLEARFDPTGERIVTRAWDTTAGIWDARSGQLIHRLEHPERITALSISADGAMIVTAMTSGEVLVWDALSGVLRFTLAHHAAVNAMAISPDSTMLVTASDDRFAVIWDLASGASRHRLPHEDSVWSVAISADGQMLVTGGKEGLVRFFALASGQQQHQVQLAGGVSSLSIAPGSQAVAAGLALSEHQQAWTDVVIADATTRVPVSSWAHNGWFQHVTFSPDGNTLATTTIKTGAIKLWDIARGTLQHTSNVQAQKLFYTPDGTRLITDPGYGEAWILDARTGHPRAAIGEPGGVKTFGLSSDGRTVTTYGADGWFRAWDAVTGTVLWQRPKTRAGASVQLSANGHRFAVQATEGHVIEIADTRQGRLLASIPSPGRTSFELSHDGRHLLLSRLVFPAPGSAGKTFYEVELWDVERGERLLQRSVNDSARGRFAESGKLVLLTDARTGLVEVIEAERGTTLWLETDGSGLRHLFVPGSDANRLIVDHDNVSRKIVDLLTGNLLAHEKTAGQGRLTDVVMFPDHEALILAVGNAIEIRDPTTGALLRKLDAGDEILALAFSVDGRWLFTAHRDVPRITAWQIADGVEVAHLDMDSQAQRLLPLADPDLLLVQGRGNALRVWRLATGKEEHRFAHTSTVDHMAVALTAERAVTSQAASLRVWDTRTGTEVAHRVSQGDIKSLAISADGRWVAYAIDQPRQNETGNTTKVLAVWEPESDRTPRLLPAPSFIHTMQFDARSRHLAVQFGGTAISVWEVNSLRSVATFQPLPDSTITEMMFSPDDERLLVEEYGRSSRRHSLRVWDMREQRELARVDVGGSVLQVSGSASIMTRDPQGVWHAWSPHTAGVAATAGPVGSVRWLGREPSHGRLTYVHDSGAVSVLDVDSGGHTQIVPPLPNVLVDTVAMAHSTDHVAMGVRLRADAAHASSVAIVYDAATATPVARLAHDGSIARLLFVTRDERLVTVSQMAATDTFSNRLRLWQWRSGDNIALSTDNPINAIAASPDGMIFATAEGQVDVDAQPLKEVGALQARLWDASTGKELRRLPHAQPVFDVAFSPDGRLLATRSNFEILIFRVADGVQLTSFQMEHGLAGGQVSFAAAGQYVIANVRHGIRVWATDGTASRLLRHEKEWPRFTISGDGIYVATATTNVRVWHIPSGAELAHTPLPSVWHLAFAGQHDALIVDTGKRLVQVLWRAEDLMTEACSRLGRNMTQEEWERFFDITPYRASCAHRATGKR